MALKQDKLTVIADEMQSYLKERGDVPFWGERGDIRLDYHLLAKGLSVPVAAGEEATTGRYAAAVDLWLSQEFERAGFGGMWPRIEQPRVVDPAVLKVAQSLPKRDARVADRLLERAGATNANVMGSVYIKQVDAGLSSWLSGPELLISTKTMSGSYGKNLSNRFEEAYGDAKNLRARYPLAAHGFFFLVRSDILQQRSAFDKAVHMLEQLASAGDVYDAVGLLLVDWSDGGDGVVAPSEEQHAVPAHLQPERFFELLIDHVLQKAPMDWHEGARALRMLARAGLGGAVLGEG